MTVGELPPADLDVLLRTHRLSIRIGPFQVRIGSSMSGIRAALTAMYGAHEVDIDAVGGHFVVRVDPPSLLRRFVRRQAQFMFDGRQPFLPLPAAMAAPMLEAGLNWCIGTFANHLLVIHAAALEHAGKAVILPAPPGSGKSTLCAALVTRGWRLLSDEFALIDPVTGWLVPVPRPVALKGESIDLIADMAPDAQLGPTVVNNEGEVVAYMPPPVRSVQESGRTCPPGLIVIPQFTAGVQTTATPMSRGWSLLHLADNSFNYNLHGRSGFERLTEIVDRAPAFTLRYARLNEGIEEIERLAEWRTP